MSTYQFIKSEAFKFEKRAYSAFRQPKTQSPDSDPSHFVGPSPSRGWHVAFPETAFFDNCEAFHEAVEDYIAYCTEEGLPLHKSYSGNLNIRINPETHSRLALYAKQKGVSLNSLISTSLDQTVLDL